MILFTVAHLLWFGHYLVEHYAEDFPSVVAIAPVLLVTIFALFGSFFYYSYIKSNNKPVVVAGILSIALTTVILKGFELGFPYDDPKQQVEALKDPTFNNWHILLHVIFITTFWSVSNTVPNDDATPTPIKKSI